MKITRKQLRSLINEAVAGMSSERIKRGDRSAGQIRAVISDRLGLSSSGEKGIYTAHGQNASGRTDTFIGIRADIADYVGDVDGPDEIAEDIRKILRRNMGLAARVMTRDVDLEATVLNSAAVKDLAGNRLTGEYDSDQLTRWFQGQTELPGLGKIGAVVVTKYGSGTKAPFELITSGS